MILKLLDPLFDRMENTAMALKKGLSNLHCSETCANFFKYVSLGILAGLVLTFSFCLLRNCFEGLFSQDYDECDSETGNLICEEVPICREVPVCREVPKKKQSTESPCKKMCGFSKKNKRDRRDCNY